jgi:zinc transport system permease protein
MLEFSDLFQAPFIYIILKALIVGVLVSVCSSLLGVNLVMKRYSMIGDGLSHVAFGAMTVATVASIAPTIVALPITVISAVLILRANSKSKLMGDASIAMISVSSLAIGYVILNVFSASSNLAGDVCSSLFGSTSILTLSTSDVILCVVLTFLIIVGYVLLYNRFFAITFDSDFSTAIGNKTELYNTILAVMSAVVIVLAMKLVGALLISALIIFPGLTAMMLGKNFKNVVILSVIISVVCTTIGIISSCLISTPAGATIVVTDLVVYLFVRLIAAIKK